MAEFQPDTEAVKTELDRLRGGPKPKRSELGQHLENGTVPKHLYRAISESDFRRARSQGYLDTHGQGNWMRPEKGEHAEGMVTATDPHEVANTYLPDEGGRVVKIETHPEHGWRPHWHDHMPRWQTATHDTKVPWEHVVDHSGPIERRFNPDTWSIYEAVQMKGEGHEPAQHASPDNLEYFKRVLPEPYHHLHPHHPDHGKMSTTASAEGQHSLYRGLYLGAMNKTTFHPPKPGEPGIGHSTSEPVDHTDDQAVLEHLMGKRDYYSRNFVGPEHPAYNKVPMFGRHWTTKHDLARRFALDATHGRYRVPPEPRTPTWGAVMEAHSSVEPEHDRLGSQFGETEAHWPGRDKITGVTMHLHRYDPEHPKGRRQDTYVRSIEVPAEHWRTASLRTTAGMFGPEWYETARDEDIDAHPAADSIRGHMTEHVSPQGHVYRLTHDTTHYVSATYLGKGENRIKTPQMVGKLTWFGGKARPDSNIEGRIHKVFVKPAHRRRGLASAMLDHARAMSPDDDIQHSNALSEDGRAWSQAHASKAQSIEVAGICIKAADTGRVLMLQRSFEDEEDPARGTWEFPGGHLDEGEDPFTGARREWCEETGGQFPDGAPVVGNWISGGMYQGFIVMIEREADLEINLDHEDRHVLNPDDPDGDGIEVVAWWEPKHLADNPAVRKEVRKGTDWDMVKKAKAPVQKAASAHPYYEVGDPDGYELGDLPDGHPGHHVTNYPPSTKVHPSVFGMTIRTPEQEPPRGPSERVNEHQDIPLSKVWGSQDYVYAPHVRNLASVPGDQMEPITGRWHTDGSFETDDHHRVAAAHLRGDTHIRAMVYSKPVGMKTATRGLGWHHVVKSQRSTMYPIHHEVEAYIKQRTGVHPKDMVWSAEPFSVSDAYPDPHGIRSRTRLDSAEQGYRSNPSRVPPIIAIEHQGKREHVDGWHRLGGAQRAGLEQVPAYVGRVRQQRTASTQQEWYHGSNSPTPVTHFERRDRQATEGGARDWNARLGSHWSSDHQVAHDFTPSDGTLHHAHLDMKNPKVYEHEYDLGNHAHKWARKNGFGEDWDEKNNAPHLDPESEDEGPLPSLDLRYHPRADEIADRFRDHLRSKGHDGIIYGNAYEGEEEHPCAIPFSNHQIHVTGTHKAGACPQGLAQREWDDEAGDYKEASLSAQTRYADVRERADGSGEGGQRGPGLGDARGGDRGPASSRVARGAGLARAGAQGPGPGLTGHCTPGGTCFDLDVPTGFLRQHIHPEYDLGDGEDRDGWGDQRVEPKWTKVRHLEQQMRSGDFDPEQSDHDVHLHVSKDDAMVEEGNHRSLAAYEADLPTLRTHVTFTPDALHRLPEVSGQHKTAAADSSTTWHPKAEKDLKSLDRPVQRQIMTTIDGLTKADPLVLAQTHPLKGTMKGWYSTKASRGHRIVHQPNDAGGLHIGYVGLHDYGDAERRLAAYDPQVRTTDKTLGVFHVSYEGARDSIRDQGIKAGHDGRIHVFQDLETARNMRGGYGPDVWHAYVPAGTQYHQGPLSGGHLVLHTDALPKRGTAMVPDWMNQSPKTAAAEPGHETFYHLTDDPHFAPRADHVPEDNAIAIRQRTSPGLYLTKRPESWLNGHGYVRPYVAEVHVPKGVGHKERWGDEHFVPAEHLDQVKVHRVIPLDEHSREEFGEPGWVEDHHGVGHDGREIVRGTWGNASFKEPLPKPYRYSGPDVRDMSPEQHAEYKRKTDEYAASR